MTDLAALSYTYCRLQFTRLSQNTTQKMISNYTEDDVIVSNLYALVPICGGLGVKLIFRRPK